MKKVLNFVLLFGAVACLMSCSSVRLAVSNVSYQSIRNAEPPQKLQKESSGLSILVEPQITADGKLYVHLTNMSDSIMLIDKTKSFFVAPSGKSTIYYDSSVNVKTTSSTSGTGNGATVNLGAVGSALGVSGAVGRILSGVNVGGSTSKSNTVSNTTYDVDAPVVSIAPRARITLNRAFEIEGVGISFCKMLSRNSGGNDIAQEYGVGDTYAKFGVCISYSTDNGNRYNHIMSNYYANSIIVSHVRRAGSVNQALRKVISSKPDLLYEPWFLLYFNCNKTSVNAYTSSKLYDCK